MKGKSHFTQSEANEIERLIAQKLLANADRQKSIRAKIRRLGFFASDYGIGGGYTVSEFRNVVSIEGKTNTGKKLINVKLPEVVKTTSKV